MPRRGDRGGAKTRARIAAVATEMFIERGFDDVTIAEVAAAADVSKVTVFAHFERKEDLLFDRNPEAIALVRTAVRDRPDDVDVVEAIRRTVLKLATERHPMSGLTEGGEPFLRTLLDSPALIARLRAFGYEVEDALAAELDADPRFSGDSALVAALLVATYRTVAVRTARRRLAGDDLATITRDHKDRVRRAFTVLAAGLDGGSARR